MMLRLPLAIVLSSFLFVGSAAAVPADVIFDQPRCTQTGSEVIAEGKVEGTGTVTLVLRIDDSHSTGYANRVNMERVVPSGAFHWRVPLEGIKTSGGTALDGCAISRIMLFVGAGEGVVSLESFEIGKAASIPAGVLAYDLGPDGSPLMAGFSRLSSGDSVLSGAALHDVARPGPDALIGDGVSGIEQIRLPLPEGKWRLTLWTEDPGEWETLPHPFVRKYTANDKVILDENLSAEQWLDRRYFRGRKRGYYEGDTPWQALGRHRGGRIQSIVDVADNGLNITLSGDSPQAGFIAGLIAEPVTSHFADEVEKQRERDFNEMWRIVPSGDAVENAVVLTPESTLLPTVMLAKDTGETVTLLLNGADWPRGARIALNHGQHPDTSAMLWQAIPQLERTSGGATALAPTRRHLFAVPAQGVSLAPGSSKFVLHITAGAAPGQHNVALKIDAGGKTTLITVPVNVMDVTLPPAAKPSGFYLDEAPHLPWGREPDIARARQLTCDMKFLTALGITGNAPALSTPSAGTVEQFITDLERISALHAALPALAYAPAKRLYGQDSSATFLTALLSADALATAGAHTPLVWSMADEPSNIGGPASGMLALVPALKSQRPTIKLAGHFNAKGDEQYATGLDVILVNTGFGVDSSALERLPEGAQVWFYNMEEVRLAAGLFLHASRARRYVQWHARMPTADPFDPTDGREDDFQMFLPSQNNCPLQPDINQTMLDMADGLVDQRWFEWLDNQTDTASVALAAKWRTISLQPWVSLVGQAGITAQFRDDVRGLARHLNSSR